jgi:molecular chaperone HscA
VLATRSALKADGHLLMQEERDELEHLIQAALDGKAFDNAAQVEAATEALAKGTEAFAAERMNAGIAKALTGKSVERL